MKRMVLVLLCALLLVAVVGCTAPSQNGGAAATTGVISETTTATAGATISTAASSPTATVTTTATEKAPTATTVSVTATTTGTTAVAPTATTTTTTAVPATTTTAVTKRTYPADRKLVITCVGDSITECGYWKESFFGMLPRDRYTVRPFGLSGATAIKSHNNAYVGSSKFARSKSVKSDIVIIMLGTNDSRASVWDKASNKDGEEFIRDYIELIDVYRNLPAHPTVMIALPPTVHKDYTGITEDYVANKVIPAVYEVGRRAGVTVIDVHTPTADDAAEFSYDGCHPSTEAGKKAIGEPIAAAILKEVND